MEHLLHGWAHLRWDVGDLSSQISLNLRDASSYMGQDDMGTVCLQRRTTLTQAQEKEKLGVPYGDLKCDHVAEHRKSYKGKEDSFQSPASVSDSTSVAPLTAVVFSIQHMMVFGLFSSQIVRLSRAGFLFFWFTAVSQCLEQVYHIVWKPDVFVSC